MSEIGGESRPENVLSQADNLMRLKGLIVQRISPQPAVLRLGARISQEGGADVPARWAAAR